ncbi:unnamed protein product, partial [Ectocarpus sp. 13 AM-2016]
SITRELLVLTTERHVRGCSLSLLLRRRQWLPHHARCTVKRSFETPRFRYTCSIARGEIRRAADDRRICTRSPPFRIRLFSTDFVSCRLHSSLASDDTRHNTSHTALLDAFPRH